MIKGAIFDADGTVLDSMYIWDRIAEDFLHLQGIEPKPDLNDIIKTYTVQKSADYFIKEYGVKLSADEITLRVDKMIEDYYKHRIPLKAGVKEFLKQLTDRNIRLCIATATDRYLIESALENCGIYEYFDEIFTCRDVGCGKGKPDIYIKASEYLGTLKSETAVFEDALYAAQTAAKEGFKVIAVYDESEKNTEKLKKTAGFYLNDFMNLKDFFEFAELS